jgi:predicted ester cyclase
MDAKKAREFYLEYLTTIYTERRVDQLGRFFAADIVAHPDVPGIAPGLPGVQGLVQGWVDAFADIRFTIDGFLVDKDMIAPRLTMSGTQIGTFLGIPSKGRRFQIIDHPHCLLRDGKIVEIWDNIDLLTLMQQLGALPAPHQGG